MRATTTHMTFVALAPTSHDFDGFALAVHTLVGNAFGSESC